jgi:hypothetical protein
MGRVGFFDLLFYVIVVAIIATLARPGSKAGTAVVDMINAFAAVVSGATGSAWQSNQGSSA